MSVLEAVPSAAVAGDTWRFTIELTDYPAPTWDLVFYAENAAHAFNSTAVDSGTAHAFTIAAATTSTVPPGRYRWSLRADDGSVFETVDSGFIQISVNPASVGTYDSRGHARKVLDALEATLESRATNDQLSMSIGGRSLSRMGVGELLEWRDKYRAEVRSEEGGTTPGLGRQFRVRCVRV